MRIDERRAALLLIDAQTSFLEAMPSGRAEMALRLAELLSLAGRHQLPTIATLERPLAKKGDLPKALREALPNRAVVHEKSFFDCFANPPIAAAVKALGRRQLILAGSETDVCVLQTVLGAVGEGYEVFLVEDCLFSSAADCSPALSRMEKAGAVRVSLKTLYYELQRVIEEEFEARARV